MFVTHLLPLSYWCLLVLTNKEIVFYCNDIHTSFHYVVMLFIFLPVITSPPVTLTL